MPSPERLSTQRSKSQVRLTDDWQLGLMIFRQVLGTSPNEARSVVLGTTADNVRSRTSESYWAVDSARKYPDPPGPLQREYARINGSRRSV